MAAIVRVKTNFISFHTSQKHTHTHALKQHQHWPMAMSTSMAVRQVVVDVTTSHAATRQKISPSTFITTKNTARFLNLSEFSSKFDLIRFSYNKVKASSPSAGSISPTGNDEEEDGISLGTMKLPSDTDVARFETLLFQWGNSLCQGANLPLPVPLKVDKIPGGARLGFITVGDGETEVNVYIDCLVFPATADNSVPVFRAVRNGPMKEQTPPGEPRIMRSLLGALKKCVEIAKL